MIKFNINESKTVIEFDYDPFLIDITKKISNRKYNSDLKNWIIPNRCIKEAYELYKNAGIKIENEEEVKEYFIKNDIEIIIKNKNKKSFTNHNFKIEKYKFKNKPFDYQKDGIDYMINNPKMLLADEMGLGKSFQSISACCILKQIYKLKKALIIVGINSVKYNWRNEIKEHSTEKCVVLDKMDKSKQIEEWLNGDEYFGIINIESLRNFNTINVLKNAVDNNIIEIIVFDEIHKIKNGRSQQGQAIQNLKPFFRIGLSGTPLMNKVEELHNIMAWLDYETRSRTAFIKQYCVLGGFKGQQILGYQNLDDLKERLSSFMLRRVKSEVAESLPPKIYKRDIVELEPDVRELYEQIREEILKEINTISIGKNPLARLTRLRQISVGTLGEIGGEGKKIISNAKFNRLVEILEEAKENNKKVLVFSTFKEVIDQYGLKLKEKGFDLEKITGSIATKKREEINKNFNSKETDDTFQLCMGTIKAMGTGLTLLADIVVFIDKDFTPANNLQAEARAHRIITKKNVVIISIIAENTVDARIEEIVSGKLEIFNQIIEGAKEIKLTAKRKRELILQLLTEDVESYREFEENNTNIEEEIEEKIEENNTIQNETQVEELKSCNAS